MENDRRFLGPLHPHPSRGAVLALAVLSFLLFILVHPALSDGNSTFYINVTVHPVCGDCYCDSGSENATGCVTDCGSCGDGFCSVPCENPTTCCFDCGICGGVYCGDGICSLSENCATCARDCGDCNGPGYCGDGVCGPTENRVSCPADCGGYNYPGGGPSFHEEIKKFPPVELELGVEYNLTAILYFEITRVTFISRNRHTNVILMAERLDGKPEGVMSDPAGEAFLFVKISVVNLNTSDLKYAIIDFRVNKTWISESGIDPTTIKLYRYVDEEWEVLETAMTGGDSDFYYYTASTPDFSYFAIAGFKGPYTPPKVVCGDGACSPSENCTSCQADCGACTPKVACGNGLCEPGEKCETCPSDCGICPPSGADAAKTAWLNILNTVIGMKIQVAIVSFAFLMLLLLFLVSV